MFCDYPATKKIPLTKGVKSCQKAHSQQAIVYAKRSSTASVPSRYAWLNVIVNIASVQREQDICPWHSLIKMT